MSGQIEGSNVVPSSSSSVLLGRELSDIDWSVKVRARRIGAEIVEIDRPIIKHSCYIHHFTNHR
jgi:hypothetical protein